MFLVWFIKRAWAACGRGWAKYRDLSVASRSIICRSRRLRQIIDLRDTDKSWYSVITDFNDCFVSRSPRLFSYFNHFLTAQGCDLPFLSWKRCSNYAWAEYYLQPFSSPEAALLLVSTKNRDLWPFPTTEVRDSRTSRHSAHALSQVWQM